MGTWTRVLDAADVPVDTGRVVEAEGKTLALFNAGGTFYAMDNTCLHRGGPLGEGDLDGTVVTCPWHGWRYDVKTGANEMNAQVKVSCYPVKIEGGAVLVDL